MKKKFRLPKNTFKTHIPLMFSHDERFITWKEQIENATNNFLEHYELGKSHYLGFKITDSMAELYVRKKIKGIDYNKN